MKPMEKNEQKRIGEEAAGKRSTGIVAALFDEVEQAEAALGELESNGFDKGQVGMTYPQDARAPADSAQAGPDKRGIFVGAPTAGFPGWTMGMAPWSFAGVGPMVVIGSISLARRKDGPDDLRGFIMSLGLHEDVYDRLQAGFERGAAMLTVQAAGKEAIASNILERNGGHSLPRN